MRKEKNTVESKIKDKLENGALAYAENTELRTLVNLIPGIGSSIDLIISSKGQKIQYERIKRTIECLREEMELLDAVKIDESFLNHEEFYDILLNVFEKSIRSRHIEKIRLNCRILVGSLTVKHQGERQFAQDMLNHLAELFPRDLKLAMIIYDQQKGELPEFTDEYGELQFVSERGWDSVHNLSTLDDVEFNLSLLNLVRAGLIREVLGSYVGYYGGNYIITDIFRRLISFAKLSEMPLFSYQIQ